MIPALAFAGCLVGGMVAYPLLIQKLIRLGAGQRIATYNPAGHATKAGTPTMGGILFVLAAAAVWAALDHSRLGFILIFALLGGGLMGAVDDIGNVRGARALGLLGWQKVALQLLVGALLGLGMFLTGDTVQYVPIAGYIDFGWSMVPLVTLTVVAASNAVNITDGIDGLAATCMLVVLAGLALMAVYMKVDAVLLICSALGGILLAFLFYNRYPARIFMGDTGSLALGCLLVAAISELGFIWLLPLMGLVFLLETASVIINVTAIRRWHRRIFRASPIHHHFEELGWSETAIVAGFSAVALVAATLTTVWAHAIGPKV